MACPVYRFHMGKRIVFWLFAIATFTRTVLAVLMMTGLFHGSILLSLNIPFSPFPVVFMHSSQFRPVYVCVEYVAGTSRCFDRSPFARQEIHEPYFFGPNAVNHGIESYLAWPDENFTRKAVRRASHYVCRGGGRRWVMSTHPMTAYDDAPREGYYHFQCSG